MSAALFRQLLRDHRETLPLDFHAQRILKWLSQCRTEAAGCHIRHCTACHDDTVRWNSCRNRHCPICQGAEQAAWVRAREADLLPIPYLHAVCTLPHALHPLAYRNAAVVYDLLLRCAQQALQDLCADPRHLGAQIGLVAVLHTWGSDLTFHPHVHMIVTGGGLADDGSWRAARVNRKKGTVFLCPVRAVRKRFRALVCAGLRQAYADGAFDERDGSPPAPWPTTADFNRWLGAVGRTTWVVYLKRPFGGPRQVVRYLGRYTHRLALHVGRLHSDDGGQTVCLQYTDYRQGGRKRDRRFTGRAFVQAFARHILPPGFRRIRMSGLWGPRVRQANLTRARAALAAAGPTVRPQHLSTTPPAAPADPPVCTRCGCVGTLITRSRTVWSRTHRDWITLATPAVEARIHQQRLSRPVPRDTVPDPENLFL